MYQKLVEKAIRAKEFSYSPYSNYKVGAAVLDTEGKIYGGCNIENASYGLAVCAERVAVFKALSEGAKMLKAIAVNSDTDHFEYAFPCGACRQVMAEFLSEDADIVVSIKSGEYKVFQLKDLLPNFFKLK